MCVCVCVCVFHRQYQAANLSVNLFFVDSVFAFSYAWCVGADSVTTNNCNQLASLSENKFYQVRCPPASLA